MAMTMGADGRGRTEEIMREIAALRAERDELNSRIRFFESQLRTSESGGRTESIMHEIAALRAEWDELDSRIRLFESQLRASGSMTTETIVALRAERDELDSRIRFLESQLRTGGADDDAAPRTRLPPSLFTKLNAMGLHAGATGQSSDMIRRYSRHLLLPDLGR